MAFLILGSGLCNIFWSDSCWSQKSEIEKHQSDCASKKFVGTPFLMLRLAILAISAWTVLSCEAWVCRCHFTHFLSHSSHAWRGWHTSSLFCSFSIGPSVVGIFSFAPTKEVWMEDGRQDSPLFQLHCIAMFVVLGLQVSRCSFPSDARLRVLTIVSRIPEVFSALRFFFI